MTDDEVIREAVGLAEGWFDNGNGTGFCPFVPERVVNYQNMGGFADLLAAQLLRQANEAERASGSHRRWCGYGWALDVIRAIVEAAKDPEFRARLTK